VDLSETCRVLYQINLRHSHLIGFYYNNASAVAAGTCVWLCYSSAALFMSLNS